MGLEDFLLPSEQKRYTSAAPVTVGSKKYRLHLTDRQIILHAKRGLLGRDDVLSWKISEINHLGFQEQGIIFRKGVLSIEAHRAATRVVGSTHDLRACYLQARAGSAPNRVS